MAITPPGIYAALVSARASGGFPLLGPNFDTIAQGVSIAVSAWCVGQPQNVALLGVSTGSSGGGTIATPTTRLIVPPTVSVMTQALSGAGFNGQMMPSLATVVTLGISQVFSTQGQYAGVVPSVGVGVDATKIVVANPSTLIPILIPLLGKGPLSPQMGTGLAIGIAELLLLGTGVGTVVGIPGPSPAVSISTSVIV